MAKRNPHETQKVIRINIINVIACTYIILIISYVDWRKKIKYTHIIPKPVNGNNFCYYFLNLPTLKSWVLHYMFLFILLIYFIFTTASKLFLKATRNHSKSFKIKLSHFDHYQLSQNSNKILYIWYLSLLTMYIQHTTSIN